MISVFNHNVQQADIKMSVAILVNKFSCKIKITNSQSLHRGEKLLNEINQWVTYLCRYVLIF